MGFTALQLEEIMGHCIELALRSSSHNTKLPHVGALVVSDNYSIVGRGYKSRDKSGFVEHGERVALDDAGYLARGATLFTTLEPCYTSKKMVFKSCSELIVERGIRRVIFGLLDNSPSMNPGSGVGYLKK
ncbi:MAG: deaminase, partial [Nanoarchaeota archaeon]